jgi:DoxX-like family
MILKDAEVKLLRYSLAFVWLATAFVSIFESEGMSLALMKDAGMDKPVFVNLGIYGGAGIDLILGLAMLFKPQKRVYLAALMVMTLIATVFAPQLWLHPLGPLTKNIPIAVILLILAKVR